MRFSCQVCSIFAPKTYQNLVLEASWAVLWASWRRLGAVLGRLGPSCKRLEASWRHRGPSWSVLERLGAVLAASWTHLGSVCGALRGSDPPTALRAGASREGKGRVPLPLVVVDRRHREWLGGTEAQSQTSTRPEARGLGGSWRALCLLYESMFSKC